MAMNILTPVESHTYEKLTMNTDTTTANNDTAPAPTTTATPGSGSGLRRKNTLKAYLANKNKLKERQAINVIVDPTVLREESSGSEQDGPHSPEHALSPTSPDNHGVSSPVSGKRIDTDLDALDEEKKKIEEQLANITQQLNQFNPPSTPTSPINGPTATVATLSPSLFPGMETKEELLGKKTKLCADLDRLLKQRRELLQSWTRDYKNLKRSGSLAKRNEDLFWVTTA
ncbi:hypothetical protein BG011_004334 [Mortierella polycephala]|uniref:Uncharacterized protein n=1 Tax=Mortierella polycephala TaxID=41804 RepID=A0A9P6U2T9_9FUNG|nr:hypothetical protein BG011_004334 [Mortierella polycephala]